MLRSDTCQLACLSPVLRQAEHDQEPVHRVQSAPEKDQHMKHRRRDKTETRLEWTLEPDELLQRFFTDEAAPFFVLPSDPSEWTITYDVSENGQHMFISATKVTETEEVS